MSAVYIRFSSEEQLGAGFFMPFLRDPDLQFNFFKY